MQVKYIKGNFKSLNFSDTIGPRKDVTVNFEGQSVKATNRFWGSIVPVLKKSTTFPTDFKLFSASECLDRLQNQFNRDLLFCVEESNNGNLTLLGMQTVNTNDHYFTYEKAIQFLEKRYGDINENLSYNNGVVSYVADTGKGVRLANNDDMVARKVLEIPIDNYRHAIAWTEFLRLICANGMKAYHKEFVKKIEFGNEVSRLTDVFDTYENSKSFGKMEEFFNRACKVQATAYELKNVMDTIKRVYHTGDESIEGNITSKSIRYKALAHSGLEQYNVSLISDLDQLSKRELQALPVKMTAFDLINLLTEARTHIGVGENLKIIDKKVGDLLIKKDWTLQDVDLPANMSLDFANHSIGNFMSEEDRMKNRENFIREVQMVESTKKTRNERREKIKEEIKDYKNNPVNVEVA